MSEVTRIMAQIEAGDPHAAQQLLPLVYDELRRLARRKLAQEKPGQTLQATALVHEAYIRLVDVEQAQHWESRGHFFSAAAEAMRRILVESARRKRGPQHGGGLLRHDLDAIDLADALRIGSQIARGLAAAHAQGLVHRDIKPANILLENGVERVKITDFGLAHAVDDVRTTQPGVVVGTPEYMSPEQPPGLGQRGGFGIQCDTFS